MFYSSVKNLDNLESKLPLWLHRRGGRSQPGHEETGTFTQSRLELKWQSLSGGHFGTMCQYPEILHLGICHKELFGRLCQDVCCSIEQKYESVVYRAERIIILTWVFDYVCLDTCTSKHREGCVSHWEEWRWSSGGGVPSASFPLNFSAFHCAHLKNTSVGHPGGSVG